jgi:hypothetical protein
MANRGARLADCDRFHTRIRRQAEDICRVEPCTIAAPETTFADLILDLSAIIQTRDITDNHTTVVVGSKALQSASRPPLPARGWLPAREKHLCA